VISLNSPPPVLSTPGSLWASLVQGVFVFAFDVRNYTTAHFSCQGLFEILENCTISKARFCELLSIRLKIKKGLEKISV